MCANRVRMLRCFSQVCRLHTIEGYRRLRVCYYYYYYYYVSQGKNIDGKLSRYRLAHRFRHIFK